MLIPSLCLPTRKISNSCRYLPYLVFAYERNDKISYSCRYLLRLCLQMRWKFDVDTMSLPTNKTTRCHIDVNTQSLPAIPTSSLPVNEMRMRILDFDTRLCTLFWILKEERDELSLLQEHLLHLIMWMNGISRSLFHPGIHTFLLLVFTFARFMWLCLVSVVKFVFPALPPFWRLYERSWDYKRTTFWINRYKRNTCMVAWIVTNAIAWVTFWGERW